MEQEKLVVKMLGDFSVAYNGRSIFLGRNLAAKTMQLFQMLMLNPGHCISKEKIMLDFYKYGDFSNKNNSLNNIIYRLRKILHMPVFREILIYPLKAECVYGIVRFRWK